MDRNRLRDYIVRDYFFKNNYLVICDYINSISVSLTLPIVNKIESGEVLDNFLYLSSIYGSKINVEYKELNKFKSKGNRIELYFKVKGDGLWDILEFFYINIDLMNRLKYGNVLTNFDSNKVVLPVIRDKSVLLKFYKSVKGNSVLEFKLNIKKGVRKDEFMKYLVDCLNEKIYK